MSIESNQLEQARDNGSFVIPNESSRPNVTIYKGNTIIECVGSHDMLPVVRSGLGWQPNRFEILREVNPDGLVKAWEFTVMPQVSPETDYEISRMLQNVRPEEGGKGRIEIGREIGNRLPRISMGSKRDGVLIVIPGTGNLRVETTPNVESEEPTPYVLFELPLESVSFFPAEILDRDAYRISSRVKLLNVSHGVLKKRIAEIIQNGTFTEERMRKIVDLSFQLERRRDEESVA